MSRPEWNGGVCPHGHFTEDHGVKTCADCGEVDAGESASGLCDYCDLEEHANCEGEGCTCRVCFPDEESLHNSACICADCSDADLTARND